eukprot:scaffold2718_cov103-Isochrysis_galbana.AAC.9
MTDPSCPTSCSSGGGRHCGGGRRGRPKCAKKSSPAVPGPPPRYSGGDHSGGWPTQAPRSPGGAGRVSLEPPAAGERVASSPLPKSSLVGPRKSAVPASQIRMVRKAEPDAAINIASASDPTVSGWPPLPLREP